MQCRAYNFTFFALVNSSTFELLVVRTGWTETQWQDWLVHLIEAELFRPED